MKSLLFYIALLCCAISCLFAQNSGAWPQQKPDKDSVKHISIRVYAKEKALNYDSLYRAQAYTNKTRNPDATPVEKTKPAKTPSGSKIRLPEAPAQRILAIHHAERADVRATPERIPPFSHTDKKDCFWIGAILIVAGIILGMILGRTAYLVSVVGAVFIVLGFTVIS